MTNMIPNQSNKQIISVLCIYYDTLLSNDVHVNINYWISIAEINNYLKLFYFESNLVEYNYELWSIELCINSKGFTVCNV